MRDLSASCRLTCHWPTCTGLGDTGPHAHVCPFGADTRRPLACTVPDCHEPGTLHAHGLRCARHQPAIPIPDPARTAAALEQLEPAAAFPHPCVYGQATSDPCGRTDWPISKQTGLPVRPKPASA